MLASNIVTARCILRLTAAYYVESTTCYPATGSRGRRLADYVLDLFSRRGRGGDDRCRTTLVEASTIREHLYGGTAYAPAYLIRTQHPAGGIENRLLWCKTASLYFGYKLRKGTASNFYPAWFHIPNRKPDKDGTTPRGCTITAGLKWNGTPGVSVLRLPYLWG